MLVSFRDTWLIASIIPAGIVLAACSQLDPATDNCLDTKPCSTIIESLDAGAQPLWVQDPQKWGCLDPSVTQAAFTPSPQPMVNLTAAVLDYATLNPIDGLTVKFCLSMDPVCDPPSGMAAPVPGMPPLLNLQIRKGAEGYLRQEAPGHVTQDYYLLAPMLADDASQSGATSAFTLVSEPSIAGFISDMGIQVDLNLGILAVFIADCNGNRVENATLKLTELETKPELASANYWAINNRFPVVGVPTDKDGTAGFTNMPEGTVSVEASVGGHSFGTTRFRVLGKRLTAGTIRPVYQTGR